MEGIYNFRCGKEIKPCCSILNCPMMQASNINPFMMNFRSPWVNHAYMESQPWVNQMHMPSIYSVEMKPVPVEEIED